jgi:hypothetical protein
MDVWDRTVRRAVARFDADQAKSMPGKKKKRQNQWLIYP